MPWVRIDEDFYQHPKVVKAGPLGMAMQVAALCYCNKYLTDGFIPRAVLPTLLNLDGTSWELVVQDLIAAGLWEQVDGGYRIHDYLDYQPSRERVLTEREATRQRVKRLRENRSSIVTGEVRAYNARTTGVQQADNGRTSEEVREKFDNPDPDPDPVLATSSSELDPAAKQDIADKKEEALDNSSSLKGGGENEFSPSFSCVRPGEIVEIWNSECGGVLPKVSKLTDQRRQKIKSRIASSPERRSADWWRIYFRKIRDSPFLCGDNDRGWRADFDWAIRSETIIARVFEGRYNGQKKIPRAFASLMELE